MRNSTSTQVQSGSGYYISIGIIGALFFIFGFVTWLNGILIPYFKIACELTNFQVSFVAFAFYISYTVMALPASWVLRRSGFRNGMMIGLWIMAVGTLIFIPAALSRTYFMFLTGLFVMGTGLAVLQTASNPYITIIGPRESAARRISIMGVCNKVAGALAPLILAFFILNDGDAFISSLNNMDELQRVDALDALSRRVIGPYLVMSAVLFLLGLMIRFSPLPEIEAESESEMDDSQAGSKANIFQFPHLILGAIALFFYVGAEVIAGDTIIRYGMSLGIGIASAKAFTTYTLIGMVVGYFIGILLIPRVISQRTALMGSAILGIILSLLAVLIPGHISVVFIALLGIANALVWPAIWPLAIHDLGRFIKIGSAILIMAIAGGAILPLAWGWLTDVWGEQQAYWVLLPCYIVILLYSVRWYKLRKW